MIERIGASAAGQMTRAIQPVLVPVSPGASDPQPTNASLPHACLIGEMNWIGAMNAFRIARTMETLPQQLPPAAKAAMNAADPALSTGSSALTPHDMAILRTNQPGEPALIPAIAPPAENHEASNDLGTRLQFSNDAGLLTGGNNGSAGASELAGASHEVNSVTDMKIVMRAHREPVSLTAKRKRGSDTSAVISRPIVFRGHLIRVGQTSRFEP